MVDQVEIHRKAMSGVVKELQRTSDQLFSDFADSPDKKQAWKDLIQLTWDKDSYVQWGAASAIGSAFQHVPDKEEAWRDLHRLTWDKDSYVRQRADVLGFVFQHIPDKEEAWNDLIRLTKDEECAECRAADALGSAFQHVPDKEEAWRDLHRLTEDDDWSVRYSAARVLGSIFPYIPDKKEAWNDLIRLTDDKDWDAPISASHPLFKTDEAGLVRISANHSMGRASIFKAINTENENDFKSELENSIKFFERSSKEATWLINPSRFCLPFYRSFYEAVKLAFWLKNLSLF